KHKEYRQYIISSYQPLHKQIYDMHPTTFFVPSFIKTITENTEESLRSIISEPSPGVYTFEMLQPDFCALLSSEFRRICKASGARVHIDIANTRNSLYRASVDFVLNSCSSSASTSTIPQIDDEDPHQFLSGLANSIALQNIRATRIVYIAVVARTRSWFLQAW
ncbi:2-oxoglutarate (2OG) and Fe(II)-dependent oxygenase superfamily protein, partial [Thalictrum thalictroides]